MKKLASVVFMALSITLTMPAHAQADVLLKAVGGLLGGVRQGISKHDAEKRDAEARADMEAREVKEKAEAAQLAKDEEEAAAKHNADLVKGLIAPEDSSDLAALYDAYDGDDLIGAPKLKPDGDVYITSAKFERVLGGRYVLNDGHSNYIAFVIDKNTKFSGGKIGDMQVGYSISIAGKYISNLGYKTLAGETKSMAVLKAIHVVLE